jgi:predicted ribonuclease YlaK
VTKVNGKAIESPLDATKAADLRDALAKCLYESLFAHITLTRSERSAIAALVTELLEGH